MSRWRWKLWASQPHNEVLSFSFSLCLQSLSSAYRSPSLATSIIRSSGRWKFCHSSLNAAAAAYTRSFYYSGRDAKELSNIYIYKKKEGKRERGIEKSSSWSYSPLFDRHQKRPSTHGEMQLKARLARERWLHTHREQEREREREASQRTVYILKS